MSVRAIGLDVGRKRIGVAGCDRTGLIATGLGTIVRTAWPQDLEQLRAIAAAREADTLVVGLPYNMDGSLGYQAKHVQKFANRLAKELALALEYVDERLTSYEAEQRLLAEGRSPRFNKEAIDRIAATIILQQWLDARRAAKARSSIPDSETCGMQ